MSRDETPKPGDNVVLVSIPPGFVDDLPDSDKRAIKAIVGKPVLLRGYDDLGRAELEFVDSDGSFHVVYVTTRYIRPLTNEE